MFKAISPVLSFDSNTKLDSPLEHQQTSLICSVAQDWGISDPAFFTPLQPDIEMAWAMRAMQHAEVYYKVRCLSSLLSRIKHVIVLCDSL